MTATNDFWTIREAAEAWGVSYRTARRYAKLLRGDSRSRIPKGTPPPQMRRGNPNFADPAKQAEYAAKRWPLSIRERMAIDLIVHDDEHAAFERLRAQARRYLHGGSAAPSGTEGEGGGA